jgi:hypothetical protein
MPAASETKNAVRARFVGFLISDTLSSLWSGCVTGHWESSRDVASATIYHGVADDVTVGIYDGHHVSESELFWLSGAPAFGHGVLDSFHRISGG